MALLKAVLNASCVIMQNKLTAITLLRKMALKLMSWNLTLCMTHHSLVCNRFHPNGADIEFFGQKHVNSVICLH